MAARRPPRPPPISDHHRILVLLAVFARTLSANAFDEERLRESVKALRVQASPSERQVRACVDEFVRHGLLLAVPGTRSQYEATDRIMRKLFELAEEMFGQVNMQTPSAPPRRTSWERLLGDEQY